MLRGFSTRWVFPILLLFFFTTTHAARILSPPDLNTVVFDAPPPSWLSPNQTLVSGTSFRHKTSSIFHGVFFELRLVAIGYWSLCFVSRSNPIRHFLGE
jgi:hypothetical protein